MMRRLRPAAVLLYLLTSCAASPTLRREIQPALLPDELQNALQAAGLGDSVIVAADPATQAPGRTVYASDAGGPVSDADGPASDAEARRVMPRDL